MRLSPGLIAVRSLLTSLAVLGLASCTGLRTPSQSAGRTLTPLAGATTLIADALSAEVHFVPLTTDDTGFKALRLPAGLHGQANLNALNGDLRPSGALGFSVGEGSDSARPAAADRSPDRRRQQASRAAGPESPLGTLTLRFHNRGSTPLRFRVTEFQSALGNFVVSPEIFELAPGATLDAAPMTSQLGAGLDYVELQLQLETSAGRETVTLELRPATAPPAR